MERLAADPMPTCLPGLKLRVYVSQVKSSQVVGATQSRGEHVYQVKSSQVVGLRDRVVIIRTLIFPSPHPYAGSGEV